MKAATKRWNWVKKGAPVIIEVGGRDVAGSNVSWLRRDQLYRDDGKLNSHIVNRDEFLSQVTELLEGIQTGLHQEARSRMRSNIVRATSREEVALRYAEKGDFNGWVEVPWCRATGEDLAEIEKWLKSLKLTFRNVPTSSEAVDAKCFFFPDRDAVERILIARAY
jgi:prolyl-tRNA synthetase